MSVLPQELLRKISNSADESSKHGSTREAAKGRFRELLQVQPVEEGPRDSQLFPFMLEEEEIEEETSLSCEPLQGIGAPSASPLALSTPVAAETGVAAAIEAPALEAAFEKMAGTMILMTCTGDRETTLFLDNPKFAASCLFGTQVTIREFSTAPKAFNIEILSNSQGVALMDAGKSALLSSFQNGSFPFTIHRFDAHIQQSEERPAFHRRESSDGEHKEQKEGRQ